MEKNDMLKVLETNGGLNGFLLYVDDAQLVLDALDDKQLRVWLQSLVDLTRTGYQPNDLFDDDDVWTPIMRSCYTLIANKIQRKAVELVYGKDAH